MAKVSVKTANKYTAKIMPLIHCLKHSLCFCICLLWPSDLSFSQSPVSPDADFTAREIAVHLFQARPGQRPDFSNHDLTYLDLSGLNFKAARLAKSDFYGADFTGANLAGADLSGTRLDRAVLIRANLTSANLSDATILRPTIYRDLSSDHEDAPDFSGANLVGTRIQAELSGSKFRGANLTGADLSPLESRPGEGTLVTLAHNIFKSCDFSGALLRNANIRSGIFTFARFNGADFQNVDAYEADFSRADLRGANVAGMNVDLANFDGTDMTGVSGWQSVRNLDKAINLDRAISVPETILKTWRAAQQKID